MRLADVLREEYIITDLEAREKKELLNEMVSVIMVIETELDRDSVLRALLERERLGTTGIGHGVAIPHGRVKGLRDLKVFFGRSRKGGNFDSMDKLPVHLFFLIMAPENSASAHLKVLASISQLLKNQEFRTRLLTADTRSEIYRAIVEAEIRGSVL